MYVLQFLHIVSSGELQLKKLIEVLTVLILSYV
jgi:hypothetical protein